MEKELKALLDKLDFEKGNGLIPVIAKEHETKRILMLAYMDREALIKTLETKMMHYWSRSKKRLWLKGEASGHYQYVKSLYADCDYDALL
ncbi:MAG: phosphoribosyl-AMP cyclohydrolase, partial [Candidatus Bathyarchaeia archaeon]